MIVPGASVALKHFLPEVCREGTGLARKLNQWAS
jgi:hypothetical protein